MICIGLCKLDWYIVVWFVELIFIFFKNDGCVFVKRKFYEIYKNNIFSMIWWWWFDCFVCKVDFNNDGYLDIISSFVIFLVNFFRFVVNLVFEDDSV